MKDKRNYKRISVYSFILLLILILGTLFYFYIYPELGDRGRAKRFEAAADNSLEKGEYNVAIQLLRQAISIDDNTKSRLKLCKLLLADGQPDEAKTNLSVLPTNVENYDTYDRAIKLYEAIDQSNTAEINMLLMEDSDNNYQAFNILSDNILESLVTVIQGQIYQNQNLENEQENKQVLIDKKVLNDVLDYLSNKFPDEAKYKIIHIDLAIKNNDFDYLANNQDALLEAISSSTSRTEEIFNLFKSNDDSSLLLQLSKKLEERDSLNKYALNILYEEAIKNNDNDKIKQLLNKGLDLSFFGGDKTINLMSNSNGNLNNQGFICETDQYYFYAHYNTRTLHRMDKQLKNDQEISKFTVDLINYWNKKVYFVSPANNRKLYCISEDGGESKEIYSLAVKDFFIIENTIYLLNQDNHHIYTININDIDNNKVESNLLTEINANEIATDGLRIYFTDIDRDNAISSMDLNGSILKELNNATSSSLNPVGGKIYYINLSSNSSIFAMQRDGTNDYPLPLPSNIKRLNVEENKDSGEEKIYYVNQGIYVSDISASEIKELTKSETSDISLTSDFLIYRNDDNNWILTYIKKDNSEIGIFEGE